MTERRQDGRVLLLYPPFGALAFPSIGLSLLKSRLNEAGIPCDIRYLNYDFLDMLPGNIVDRLQSFESLTRRNDYCVGDWIFNRELFGVDTVRELDERFFAYLGEEGLDREVLDEYLAVKKLAPRFLDRCMDAFDWDRYAIVGLHSIFNQTTAGLALSARIKRRRPEIVTLFGGPSVAGEMGRAVLAHFPQIDYLVQGEADRTIVPLIRGLLEGGDVTSIKGLMWRCESIAGAEPPFEVQVNPVDLIMDMDTLPVPDYSDFFARFEGRGYEHGVDVFLPFETSRGCWWGMRQHCTFCGLNTKSMTYRSKSPERALKEIRGLYELYGTGRFACVDSILDMKFFRTLLPMLRDSELDLKVFYEIKANLRRDQLRLLADAGVTLLQPGIEHLSTEVLGLMHKGTTYRRNVNFLKWARESDLTIFWSILYGFPGEEESYYEAVAERIPSLYHMYPPKHLVKVRVDRFSPLFDQAAELGLNRVVPARGYRHVYPFEEAALRNFAYHFEGEDEQRDPRLDERIVELLGERIREWNHRFFQHGARLDFVASGRRVLIRDTRYDGPPRLYLLTNAAAALYQDCDVGKSRAQLESEYAVEETEPAPDFLSSLLDGLEEEAVIERILRRARHADHPVRRLDLQRRDVRGLLSELLAARLMNAEGELVFSLACRMDDPRDLFESKSREFAALNNMAATRDVIVGALPGG